MSDNIEMTIDLSDFLIEDATPENFDPLTFIVNDDGEAAWAMRNLATASRRIDAIEKQANEEAERIERWVAYATKSHRETAKYFKDALESYMIRIREQEDRKSLSLPDGDISSRSIQAKAAVSDLGVFLKFCEETGRNQWVRIKKEADLSALKDHVEFDGDTVLDADSGEVIDGLVHIEGAVSVNVKVSE
jgi:phage host-nuclease inhibitor protein Gam